MSVADVSMVSAPSDAVVDALRVNDKFDWKENAEEKSRFVGTLIKEGKSCAGLISLLVSIAFKQGMPDAEHFESVFEYLEILGITFPQRGRHPMKTIDNPPKVSALDAEIYEELWKAGYNTTFISLIMQSDIATIRKHLASKISNFKLTFRGSKLPWGVPVKMTYDGALDIAERVEAAHRAQSAKSETNSDVDILGSIDESGIPPLPPNLEARAQTTLARVREQMAKQTTPAVSAWPVVRVDPHGMLKRIADIDGKPEPISDLDWLGLLQNLIWTSEGDGRKGGVAMARDVLAGRLMGRYWVIDRAE